MHCAARDRWIGWSSLQRRQRLFVVAKQSRFLLLHEPGRSPHLEVPAFSWTLETYVATGVRHSISPNEFERAWEAAQPAPA